MHKRAQTANPAHKHKHQETILKEIKATIHIDQLNSQHTHPHPSPHPPKTSLRYSKEGRNSKKSSPFARKIREIEQLNGRDGRSAYSLEKDEGRICEAGWSEFGEKMERATHSHLLKIRKKAIQIRNKASVSSIFTKSSNCHPAPGGIELGEQPVVQLWRMVRGSEGWGDGWGVDRFMRVDDLRRDVDRSYVLKNAYQQCVNSKGYKQSLESSFVEQKLKSFVYLQENESKLSRKRLEEILNNNYFLA